jgi:hypothetical protein
MEFIIETEREIIKNLKRKLSNKKDFLLQRRFFAII